MNSINKIGIDLIGLGKVLFNNNLMVPIYQRSYAWEEKHVSDLFSDIQNSIDQDEPEYFIGSIVVTKRTGDRLEVVDGQQRLATAVILLAAIRDYCLIHNEDERATTIQSKYLHTKDIVSLNLIPKLQLNNIDNDFFSKRILASSDSPDRAITSTKESHHKIEMAANKAKAYVSGIKDIKSLMKLVNYIHDSLKIILVTVPDDSNAFIIFETLNDRGLALAISDLLKNYLFGISGARISEVQQRWLAMAGTLETIEDEGIMLTYIRHLWSSRNGLVRERELYASIKKEIKGGPKAVAFATELADEAKLYVAMLNPNHEFWGKYGDTTRQHIHTLNLLRMIQVRPLLLAILSKFDVSEVREAIRLMVSWAVRLLIRGGLGGGTLETHYSSSGTAIRDGSITTAKQLSEKLKSIVPTDAIFKQAFVAAVVSKQYLARYYLRVLEKQAKGEQDPELVPNENSEQINLEHILPINPSKAWSYIPEDDQVASLNRIGNLALLKNKINTDAGNDSFKYKKNFYAKSNYKLTVKLAAIKEDWSIKQIEERQKDLANLAIKAWPLK